MYRSEKFEGSAAAYRELIGIPTGVYNEYSDLHVNTAAVAAQMLWSGDGHSVTCSSPVEGGFEAFETAYNAACGAIARKDWAQAVVLLKKSSGWRSFNGLATFVDVGVRTLQYVR